MIIKILFKKMLIFNCLLILIFCSSCEKKDYYPTNLEQLDEYATLVNDKYSNGVIELENGWYEYSYKEIISQYGSINVVKGKTLYFYLDDSGFDEISKFMYFHNSQNEYYEEGKYIIIENGKRSGFVSDKKTISLNIKSFDSNMLDINYLLDLSIKSKKELIDENISVSGKEIYVSKVDNYVEGNFEINENKTKVICLDGELKFGEYIVMESKIISQNTYITINETIKKIYDIKIMDYINSQYNDYIKWEYQNEIDEIVLKEI